MSASGIAILGVGQSYFALGMVKQLSESKNIIPDVEKVVQSLV